MDSIQSFWTIVYRHTALIYQDEMAHYDCEPSL
jgi:hypothetical protein